MIGAARGALMVLWGLIGIVPDGAIIQDIRYGVTADIIATEACMSYYIKSSITKATEWSNNLTSSNHVIVGDQLIGSIFGRADIIRIRDGTGGREGSTGCYDIAGHCKAVVSPFGYSCRGSSVVPLVGGENIKCECDIQRFPLSSGICVGNFFFVMLLAG